MKRPKLNKALFWDTDIKSIDFDKHARYVIERAITRGDIHDWKEIMNYYGLNKIKEEIVNIRHLNKLTFNFCQIFFNIEKSKFRCYNTDPSIQQLWNY